MNINNDKNLHRIVCLIIGLSIITSSIGLFYTTGGKIVNFINQYGDKVILYGDGLYAHDSYFKAPIFRGTDFTILFAAVPILIAALILDIRKKTLKSRLLLMSVISIFTYYSASIAFGVTYNVLHLVYIALFSGSFFGLIISVKSINFDQVSRSIIEKIPYKALYIFTALTGIALFVAWLPDIISSLITGKSLQLIEVYTTEITYVIDMGIVAPCAFICLFQLRKRNGLGYVLLAILLTICIIMGLMLPVQTVFQLLAGIQLPIAAIVTKTLSFVLLGIFALYFNIKLYRSIK